MKKSNQILSAVFLFIILASAFACSGGGGGESPDSDSETADFVGRASLGPITAAQEEILSVDNDAIIIWATGVRQNGDLLVAAEDTDTWAFIAANRNNVMLSWDMVLVGGMWSISLRSDPPVTLELVDLTTMSMDVSAAWQLVQESGLAEPFLNWVLLEEINLDFPNAVYAFSLPSGRLITVDTVTQEVAALDAPVGRFSLHPSLVRERAEQAGMQGQMHGPQI